jgi:RNA polymerase sigma-70 factor (ECF subfamily)
MDTEQRMTALDEARAGNDEALGRLLESFTPYVRVIARALRSGRVQARLDDSDLIQSVFLEAHQHFATFRGTTMSELAAWLRQIAVRTTGRAFRDQARTGKRDPDREQPLDDVGPWLADPGTSPSQRAIKDEQAARIAEALTQLPEDMQHVLLGRHVDDLSHAQLAGRLGRTDAAVRMLYLRALQRLRQILAEPA